MSNLGNDLLLTGLQGIKAGLELGLQSKSPEYQSELTMARANVRVVAQNHGEIGQVAIALEAIAILITEGKKL